jgi:hypothetical protein
VSIVAIIAIARIVAPPEAAANASKVGLITGASPAAATTAGVAVAKAAPLTGHAAPCWDPRSS